MAGEFVQNTHFEDQKGLDLQSSNLTRAKDTATEFTNVEKEDGVLTQRKGSAFGGRNLEISGAGAPSKSYLGPYNYRFFDGDTSTTKQELLWLAPLAADSPDAPQLEKLGEGSFDITYTGGATTVTLVLIVNSSNVWELTITEDAATTYTNTYGTGLEDSFDAVTDIESDIDALTDFSVTTTGTFDSLTPVGSLGPVASLDLSSGSGSIEYNYGIPVPPTGATILGKTDTNVDFTNPDYINFNDILYIAPHNYLWKYDGRRFYRAGLSRATIDSIVETVGAGAVFASGEEYIYKVVYKRIDNRGQIIEGADSNEALTVATFTVGGGGADSIDVTFDTLTDTDFNVESAIVDGTQSGVTTITVDSGHTISTDANFPNNEVYFFDGVSGEYVVREVTSTTATSITISGAAVDVTDDAILSNNVRIQVYRTVNTGLDFFLVDEIPNNSLASTQTYTDSTVDASLGVAFVEQQRRFDLPPKCSLLGEHQGLLFASGDPDNPNRVYFSDIIGGPEAFPAASNSFEVPPTEDGKVTAFKSDGDNTLAVFKEKSYFNAIGEIGELRFTVVSVSEGDLGVTSHQSLRKIRNTMFGLSLRGPVTIEGGAISLALGIPLSPVFRNANYIQESGTAITTAEESKLVFKRAVALNDFRNELYILYVPAESGTPGTDSLEPNGNSRIFVFNYEEGTWAERTIAKEMLPHTGMAIFKNQLFWTGVNQKVTAGPLGVARSGAFWRELLTQTQYDAADNTDAISWVLAPQWEDGGNPASFMKFLWLKLYVFAQGLFVSNFDIEIEEYRDYDETSVYTNTDRSFSSDDKEKRIKMASGKSRAMQLKFKNENLYEVPFLTGYELTQGFTHLVKPSDAKGD